ncbi:MAG: carboxymuconolactone decarboxylase family protein [Terriglobales bacterium]
MDSHAYFLREQGADEQTVRAIAQANPSAANLSEKERALLSLVERVTNAAHTTHREHTDLLRQHGWTDEQIAEAVYIAALFAFFNRVADAFGIPPMGYLQAKAKP